MKVLITGAHGQLGKDLTQVCELAGDDVVARGRSELDITNADAVAELVRGVRPDCVFNCAAWTAVDDCESDPERANLVNGTAVQTLGEISHEVGGHLVQVSTDYVFDGSKPDAYQIDDPTNPASAYGASKVLGEQAALAFDASVVRTAWVFSAHGGNMVATILRLAQSHDELTFVSDQRGNPTFTADLAPALRNLGRDRVPGLAHVTNAGETTWHRFTQDVFKVAGLDPERVKPILTKDLQPQRPAPRPENSVLANDRYVELGYAPLRNHKEALRDVVPHYL